MKTPLIILGLAGAWAAFGGTQYYVSPTGDNDATGDIDHPFKTIDRALTAATQPYDEVLVADGTYAIETPLVMNSNLVTLRSASGNRAQVTIDAQGRTNCLYVAQNCTIRDITFANGRAAMNIYKWQGTSTSADLFAGGIYCRQRGTVSNCVVRNCRAIGNGVKISGGGIYGYQTIVLDTLVENCSVENTSSSTSADVKGGGIYNDNWSGSPGAGFVSGCTVRNCSVSGRAEVDNIRTVTAGGVFVNNAAVLSNTTVTACSAHLANAPSGAYGASGGGVAVSNGGGVFDCRISECVAESAAGGLYAFDTGAQVAIERCQFTANCLESITSSFGNNGSAVYASAAACRLTDCVFRANTNAFYAYNGGGTLSLEGCASVRGCLFEKNRSLLGSGVFLSGAADSVIERCVFRENVTYGNGGVIAAYQPNGVLVDRCAVISNTAENAAAVMVRISSGSASVNGLTVRNSFFTGNVSLNPWGYGFYSYLGSASSDMPLTLEFCTIAGNMKTTGSHSYYSFFRPDGSSSPAQFVVKGCVIADNGINGNNGFPAAFATSECISNTYASSGNYPEAEQSNLDHTLDPQFANPAAGDYRLSFASPLRNAGGTAAAWMQDAEAKDLGTGYAETTAEDVYGVAVAFPQEHRRVEMGAPDVGCFEYHHNPPTTLIVR